MATAPHHHLIRLLASAALLLAPALAYAQYVWIDEKGLKQFSDRAPPPSTPLDKILQSPTPQKPIFDAPEEAQAAEAAAPGKPVKGPPTLADRDADFRKRAKEKAEQAQKEQQEARRRADIAANCEAARRNKLQLESGARIGVTSNNGERAFMDDAQRAEEMQKTNRVLADCR